MLDLCLNVCLLCIRSSALGGLRRHGLFAFLSTCCPSLQTCMECRAVGIVSSADVQAVLGHLQALAGSTSSPLKVHETVLRHGTPTVASLRIRTPLNQDDTTGTRSAGVQLTDWPEAFVQPATCTCRSDVRHESKYMASREARKLPASVRTVTSSSCSTDGCYRFWAALGYAVDHELIMDGCSFLIYQEGHQVRASLGV